MQTLVVEPLKAFFVCVFPNSSKSISVFLLVRAGARADGHNEDLGVSPVHVACQVQGPSRSPVHVDFFLNWI